MKKKDEKEEKEKNHSILDLLDEQILSNSDFQSLDESSINENSFLSTGILELDYALGGKGLTLGTMYEICGEAGSGKTTLALCIAKEAIKKGGFCVFFDAESALNKSTTHKTLKEFIIKDKRCFTYTRSVDAESIFKNIYEILNLLKSNKQKKVPGVIILDSIASLVLGKEIENIDQVGAIGVKARFLSDSLRKLLAPLSESGAVLIFTNQMRANLNQNPSFMFNHNTLTSSGGNAIKYYVYCSLQMKKESFIRDENLILGQNVGINIIKNKHGGPRPAYFRLALYYDNRTFYFEKNLVDMALKYKIMTLNGSWISYKGKSLQGSEAFIKLISEDAAIRDSLIADVQNFIHV